MSRKKVTETETFLGIGYRIRKIRGGLSQEVFGEIIGVTKASISRYESGRVPDLVIIKKIAAYGGVTVEWFLRGAAAPAPSLTEFASEAYDARPLRPLETALLTAAILKVEEVLTDRRRLKLTPAQKSRLISFLYEHCRENQEQPSRYLVERYLLLTD